MSPPTMMVPPFWSMPVREPTSPLQTRSPPRIAAPKVEPAFFSTTTVPAIMFSPHDQPTRPVMRTFGPSIRPTAEVAQAAFEDQVAAVQDADAEECLAPGFLTTIVP